MSSFKSTPILTPRLDRALTRLDSLVDWERRARSSGSTRLMRQSVAPARDLLDRLGRPDRELACVLIAGTKAKGSVASLVAAGLRRVGIAEGFYSSPHVERVQERIRIRGAEIEDERLAAALERALDARAAALAETGPRPAACDATWFDVLTAAAIDALREAGVQWAILECGLGGRLDSTNAVEPRLGVITNIDLEHTAILGTTRRAIAREKAGIARAGVPLVSAVRTDDATDDAADEIASSARAAGARLVRVELDPRDSIEESNVALARAVLSELGLGNLDAQARAEARLPGRLEIGSLGSVPVVLDGAHVPASLERVLAELARGCGGRIPAGLPTVVFAAGVDKDTSGLLKLFRGRADRVLCTSLGNGPYASAERLHDDAARVGVRAEMVTDPDAALDMAIQQVGSNGWVLVTGSLHLVGRLRRRILITPERLR